MIDEDKYCLHENLSNRLARLHRKAASYCTDDSERLANGDKFKPTESLILKFYNHLSIR